eukprot:243138_1
MVVVTGNFELAVEPALEVVPIPQQLTLGNNGGGQLAFKIKCTDNNVIKIEPATGLIPVGGSVCVSLSPGSAPAAPQTIFIMNAPADGAPNAQAAFAGCPEGSGKVELD